MVEARVLPVFDIGSPLFAVILLQVLDVPTAVERFIGAVLGKINGTLFAIQR